LLITLTVKTAMRASAVKENVRKGPGANFMSRNKETKIQTLKISVDTKVQL